MAKVEVIMGGILTTVQDFGRIGYQKFGIGQAGVMDEYSYELSNILVGNKSGEAVFEITYLGPTLKVDEDVTFAVTGADVTPKVDGIEVAMYETHLLKAGSTLSFGKLKSGMRAYLAFSGEIGVEELNGSKSTLIKSKIGGYKGRALKPKDEFEILNARDFVKRVIPEKYRPVMSQFAVLRAVLGPQDDYFTEEGIKKFFMSGGYTITKNADRMGIRLDGNPLEFKKGADIISDGTVKGSVQVPADGRPIVLMADRQTTGGYTKISTVITPDICKLSQMAPHGKVLFQQVSIEEAQKIYKDYRRKIEEIRNLV